MELWRSFLAESHTECWANSLFPDKQWDADARPSPTPTATRPALRNVEDRPSPTPTAARPALRDVDARRSPTPTAARSALRDVDVRPSMLVASCGEGAPLALVLPGPALRYCSLVWAWCPAHDGWDLLQERLRSGLGLPVSCFPAQDELD
ncbi:hypothetical protein Droror1_Dr00021493 [Drosera rotundifolia]